MALWQIGVVAPCFQYEEWDGVTTSAYNQYLITPPRHYIEEAIDNIGMAQFVYSPGNDRLVAYIWFYYAYWPSWRFARIEWNAETGAYIRREETSFWAEASTYSVGVGSYGQLYKIFNSRPKWVSQVRWEDLGRASGDWEVGTATWPGSPNPGAAIINREDDIYAFLESSYWLRIWENCSSSPNNFGSLRVPGVMGNLSWESRSILWVITSTGYILKCNYQIPRWEMLSQVQNPTVDSTGYLCAFDTKRSRLAVLRMRPEAADGACRWQLEFYRPIPALARSGGLTDPVPTSSLRGSTVIDFVAQLYGDTGEPLAPYRINASLVAPVDGTLLTPFGVTGLGGLASFKYEAPAAVVTDTLLLSCTYTDGEGVTTTTTSTSTTSTSTTSTSTTSTSTTSTSTSTTTTTT